MLQAIVYLIMVTRFVTVCTAVYHKQPAVDNGKFRPCLIFKGRGHFKVNVQESSRGCCVFVPFFPRELGCCANRLYHRSTHKCCDDWQIVPNKIDACASMSRFWHEDFLEMQQQKQHKVPINLDSLQRSSRSGFHCSFDKDTCGWKTYTNSPLQGWKIQGRQNNAMRQATENSYLHVQFLPTPRSTVVYLISPLLHLQSKQCLVFWYYLYDVTIPSTITMDVIVQQAAYGGRFSSRSRFVTSSIRWRHATIDLNPGQQGIAFVARSGSLGSGSLSIDDVTMTSQQCPEQIINCFFDSDLCGWIQEYADKVPWQRGKKFGHDCIFVTAPNESRTNTISTVRSSSVNQVPLCIRFKFYLKGFLSLQLSGLSKHLLSSDTLWSAKGSTGNRWMTKMITVHETNIQNSWLQFQSNLTENGHAAVDDVAVTSGVCGVTSFGCDFDDRSLCGWSVKNDVTGNSFSFRRRWSHPTKEDTFNEFNNEVSNDLAQTGFYIYFRRHVNHIHPMQVIVMSSPRFEISTTSKCFRFSHKITQRGRSGTLEVYLKRNALPIVGSSIYAGLDFETLQPKSSDFPILTLNGNEESLWNTSSVPIKDVGVYNIEIKITAKIGYHGEIAVDDVMLVDGDCFDHQSNKDENNEERGEIKCNFDLQSFCGWKQDQVTDDFDWQLNSATTRQRQVAFLLTGPEGDHTTNNSYYAYIPSNEQVQGDVARLTSPGVHLAFNLDYCFTFWHHIRGYNTGNLTVSTEDQISGKRTKLWTKSVLTYDDLADWEITYLDVSPPSFSDSLSMFTTLRFVIEANVISYYGDIAIDDIMFHNVSCQFVKSGLPSKNDRVKYPALQQNTIPTKPPLLYSIPPPSGEVESRFHTSFAYKVKENRDSVALLVDASTSRCNQTGDGVIIPSSEANVESAKSFLANLIQYWSEEKNGLPSLTLTTYAGWQRNVIADEENLTARQTLRRINAIQPMCAAGRPLRRLSRASHFIRHHMTSQDDVVTVIVVAQSLKLGNSRDGWRLAGHELSALHSRLSDKGRRVFVLGVGTRKNSSSFYKSELSLVACGHVIHTLCDDIFFTDDVTVAKEVASLVNSERERRMHSNSFEASSEVL